jgi:hypothetical protein
MASIRWSLEKAPGGGWRGLIHLPDGYFTAGQGPTKKLAMAKAAGLAEKVLDNPLLKAALPPQAQLALKGAKLLAAGPAGALAMKALKSKKLKSFAKGLFG